MRIIFIIATMPGGAVVVAAFVFAVWLLARRIRFGKRMTRLGAHSATIPRSLLGRVALVGGVVTVLAFLLAEPAGDLLVSPPGALWWTIAVSGIAALATLGWFLAIVRRERPDVAEPVFPPLRRTWLTFVGRKEGWLSGVATAVLLATCLIGGLSSSPDPLGWYTRLEIPVGDLEPGSVTFFGWAYAVPVVIVVVLSAAVTFVALRCDAMRPFRGPDTVEAETLAREASAGAALRLYSGSLYLMLGSAWMLIGGAGMGSVGVGLPDVGNFMFAAGYAAIAEPIFWTGFAIEVLAVLLLLGPARRARSVVAPAERVTLASGS